MKIKIAERERILLILTGAAFILFLFFQFIYLPKSNDIHRMSQILKKDNQDLKTAKEKEKLLQNLEQYPMMKTKVKKGKEEQTVEALKYLSSAITQLDIELISMHPKNEAVKVESANAVYFDLELLGSYNNIYKFLKALEALPILILVDSIDLNRADKDKISAKFMLSVYY